VKVRWDDAEAAAFAGPIGECVYCTRLIGSDPSLVLHGGGNSSVSAPVGTISCMEAHEMTSASTLLTGRPLRYLLSLHLRAAGPLTVAELVARVEGEGFALGGRAGKVVSDSLRWEIGRRRAVRLGRGRYGPGVIPRQTLRRMVDVVDAERRRVRPGLWR